VVQSLLISIPFWSDFNPNFSKSLLTSSSLFQSHFGLILIVEGSVAVEDGEVFQSHFGLILIGKPRLEDYEFLKISIPFWSDFNTCSRFRGF